MTEPAPATATDRTTIFLVLGFVGVLTLGLELGVFFLLRDVIGEPDPAKQTWALAAIALLSQPAGIGLGILGATLNNTRTVQGATPAPVDPPPPSLPFIFGGGNGGGMGNVVVGAGGAGGVGPFDDPPEPPEPVPADA